MKKGMALEGFICPDGTVRPLEKYDDTELREKIQTNTDDIDNLKSRVTAVEGGTHISADGEITPGNLVEFSENNTLKDTGKKKTDFAPATGSTAYAAKVHSHSAIFDGEGNGISVDGISGEINIEVFDGESGGETAITPQNIGNLHRALQNPATPVSGGNNLITNGQVFNALVSRDNNISNLQAQLNAISARVLALETPTWSETGVDVSSMRYDADVATFANDAEAYGGFSIGDQVKAVVTLDGTASTIYTTVINKYTGPYRVKFADDIYPTVTAGQTLSVILYKRAS